MTVARATEPDTQVAARWDFAEFFGRYAAQVAIITTKTATGAPTGCTCTAVIALSATPPSLLVSFMNSSNTLRRIREAGTFGVNAMGVGGEEAVRRLATKAVDKFDGIPWFHPEGYSSPNAGVMLARGVLGYARCRVEDVVEVGDHSLVVGHIDEIFAGDVTAPLLHAERRMWFPTALPVNLAG